jgi:hypothetical protein
LLARKANASSALILKNPQLIVRSARVAPRQRRALGDSARVV